MAFYSNEDALDLLLSDFELNGYHIARGILSQEEIDVLKKASIEAIELESSLYINNGMTPPNGRIFSCVAYDDAFLQLFLNDYFYKIISSPFDEKHPVLHVYTTSSIPPHSVNTFNHIHCESKHYDDDFLEGIGCLVMLSDFTGENGATRVLPKSHRMKCAPDNTVFEKMSYQVLGQAGDVLIFHPRLWHRSSSNATETWRHSLSIGISRPWLRPHIDHYHAARNPDLVMSEPRLKQLVGYFARPYESEDDYYERS